MSQTIYSIGLVCISRERACQGVVRKMFIAKCRMSAIVSFDAFHIVTVSLVVRTVKSLFHIMENLMSRRNLWTVAYHDEVRAASGAPIPPTLLMTRPGMCVDGIRGEC